MPEQPDNKTEVNQPTPQRIGFMAGQLSVPDDFDTMCRAEIEELFCGEGKAVRE